MTFDYLFYSFKTHIKEIGISLFTGVLGLITLQDIHTFMTMIGVAIGTVVMPVYFGWRRYKKQEEREMEGAVIKAIKDLRELGFIKESDSLEEQRNKAVEWLKKPVEKI
jgi:hypothetical protein